METARNRPLVLATFLRAALRDVKEEHANSRRFHRAIATIESVAEELEAESAAPTRPTNQTEALR